jgi:hypothetical protein
MLGTGLVYLVVAAALHTLLCSTDSKTVVRGGCYLRSRCACSGGGAAGGQTQYAAHQAMTHSFMIVMMIG